MSRKLNDGELEELNDLCCDIDELVKDIRSGVKEVKGLRSEEAKENKLSWLEGRIERVRTVYEGLSLEIRAQGKHKEGIQPFKEKARGYKHTINSLINEVNECKDPGAAATREDKMVAHADQFSTGQLLQAGINIQEKSIESLARQLQLIEQSKEIATETLGELARQEEQLLKIATDVTQVQENLSYAGKQLRSIARRMAGDKILRVMCILLLLALLGVIIAVLVLPEGSFKTSFDEFSSGSSVFHEFSLIFSVFISFVFICVQ